jgi:PAS domain S-box-containing protein
MATKQRKMVSNVLLVFSLTLAGILWAYGARMAKNAHEQEHRNQAWRDIIDHSPSAIVVANTDGVIVQWSEGAERLLGWQQIEAEGSTLQLLMPPDRYEQHQGGFYDEEKRALLINGGVLQVEGYVLNEAGDVVHVQVRITAVTNGHQLFVATLTPVAEVVVDPHPAPPPPQMHYPPRDIQQFRKGS